MIKAGIVERAFELARSGEFRTVNDITKKLYRENYDHVAQHLAGKTISRQLKTVIAAGRVGDMSEVD